MGIVIAACSKTEQLASSFRPHKKVTMASLILLTPLLSMMVIASMFKLGPEVCMSHQINVSASIYSYNLLHEP
jgi:hypothetical protein